MNFKEFIADLLLNEMAFNKKKMEEKIENLENQINLHLIKIIRYDDEVNKQKHINDIMNWLDQIQRLDFNKKGNKFSKELYFKLLFEQPITDDSNNQYIMGLEKGQLRRYSNLPRKRTIEETLIILFKIHKEIARLLSNNEIFDIEIELEKI